jgi:hypothetical protein
MTEREALKLALDALNEVTGWQWAGPMRVMDEVEDAITAIKQALEQPEPDEPVACIGTNGELMWLKKPTVVYSKPQPLYTSPPKREPLTDEQIDALLGKMSLGACADDIRLVEAAHGIKE